MFPFLFFLLAIASVPKVSHSHTHNHTNKNQPLQTLLTNCTSLSSLSIQDNPIATNATIKLRQRLILAGPSLCMKIACRFPPVSNLIISISTKSHNTKPPSAPRHTQYQTHNPHRTFHHPKHGQTPISPLQHHLKRRSDPQQRG